MCRGYTSRKLRNDGLIFFFNGWAISNNSHCKDGINVQTTKYSLDTRYLHSCNKDLIKRPNLLPTEKERARFPEQTVPFPTRSHLNCRNNKLGEWPDLPLKGQSKGTDHIGLPILGTGYKKR